MFDGLPPVCRSAHRCRMNTLSLHNAPFNISRRRFLQSSAAALALSTLGADALDITGK